jgi:hypothetical protein
MYITHVEISNYKSFHAPTTIDFLPGFNVITGKNNAGKTSLLEGLTLNFNGMPHRSLETVPVPGAYPADTSSILITLVLQREEMLNQLRNGGPYYLATPGNTFHFADGTAFGGPDTIRRFTEWFLSKPEFTVSVRRSMSHQEKWVAVEPGFGLYDPQPAAQGDRSFIQFRVGADGTPFEFGATHRPEDQDIGVWLGHMMQRRIYRFFAERFNISQCAFGTNSFLAANAQNLPEELNVLQGNHQ